MTIFELEEPGMKISKQATKGHLFVGSFLVFLSLCKFDSKVTPKSLYN